jgi:hypothetical protein
VIGKGQVVIGNAAVRAPFPLLLLLLVKSFAKKHLPALSPPLHRGSRRRPSDCAHTHKMGLEGTSGLSHAQLTTVAEIVLAGGVLSSIGSLVIIVVGLVAHARVSLAWLRCVDHAGCHRRDVLLHVLPAR